MKIRPRIVAGALLAVSALMPTGCATREKRTDTGTYPGVKHHGWSEWEEDHYNDWWQSVMQ